MQLARELAVLPDGYSCRAVGERRARRLVRRWRDRECGQWRCDADGEPRERPGLRWVRDRQPGGETGVWASWRQESTHAPREAVWEPETELPLCPDCQKAPLVFRGRWECSCGARKLGAELADFAPGAAWPRGVRMDRVRAEPVWDGGQRPLFTRLEADNSTSWRPDLGNGPLTPAKRDWLAWLSEVEALTSLQRQARRAHFGVKRGRKWHQDRMRGQEQRFDRVRSCGRPDYMLHEWSQDRELVSSRALPSRCGCWRVCVPCMQHRRFKLAQGMEAQRELALRQLRRQLSRAHKGPVNAGRREGAWSERLVTLTVPHGPSPAEDVRTLKRAWALWWRKMLEHFDKDRGGEQHPRIEQPKPVWVRAFEVAPGRSEAEAEQLELSFGSEKQASAGHAHIHVWLISPYVDHTYLRVTWGRVLESLGVQCPQRSWEEALRPYDKQTNEHGPRDARTKFWLRTRRGAHGRKTETVPWPHVDVRQVKDVGGGEYATKVGVVLYLTKGFKGTRRVNPWHVAAVYEALEGARCVQWARGWAPPRKRSMSLWSIAPMPAPTIPNQAPA